MSVKIQKWGNSLGVRIPKTVMEKVNLKENSEVEIESKNGTIVIFPATKKYSLDDLIDQITKSNLHSEEAFKSEGDEVW
jgi:antitoxin MazE